MSAEMAASAREDAIQELLKITRHLAAIQDPEVRDKIGFSNSDVSIGRVLAAIVEAQPDNQAMLTRLAMLVAVKYANQGTHEIGEAKMRAIHQLIATSDRVGGGGPT